MSTPRRALGHGSWRPQTPASSTETGTTRRVRATEADIEAVPLYRPGSLDSLQQLRDRGVLGPSAPPA